MKRPPMNNDTTLTITRETLKDSFGYEGKSIEKYGNVYQFKILTGPTRGAFSHEAFVEYCGNRNNLRHTVDPIYWKKSSEAVAPSFLSDDCLQKYTPLMVASTLQMSTSWNSAIQNRQPVDVKSEALILASRNVLYNFLDDIDVDFERFFIEQRLAQTQPHHDILG